MPGQPRSAPTETGDEARSFAVWWPWILGACLVLSTIGLLEASHKVHEQVLHVLVSWVAFFRTRSLAACSSYLLAYLCANLFCVPLTPFEILTGFIFGLPYGILVDVIGRTLSALVCFNISRMLVRSNAECGCLKGSTVAKGVGSAVEEQGLRFLILFNLAYMPAAVKNYGLGFVPEVKLLDFLTAIFLVEIPLASIWAFIGNRVAHELDAEGVSLSDFAAVRDSISGAAAGSHLKTGVLLVGVFSILLVLHRIQHKISSELAPLVSKELVQSKSSRQTYSPDV